MQQSFSLNSLLALLIMYLHKFNFSQIIEKPFPPSLLPFQPLSQSPPSALRISLILTMCYSCCCGLKAVLSNKNNILIMQNSEPEMQLILRYSKKARNLEHYHGILQQVQATIDYRPYGIDKLLGDKALTLFVTLKEKYRRRELTLNQDGWYQTEKKVFVWFVVMHTYYLEKEGVKLGSIAKFREVMDFEGIAKMFFRKSVFFIEFQLLSLVKIIEKIQWSEEEDRCITRAVEKCGSGRWADVSREIFQASQGVRFLNAKNCRERWQNHLDGTKIKGNWTLEEDLTIVEAVLERYGKKWSKMKGELNFRRTEHMIKNRFNSLMTKNKKFRNQKQKQVSQRVRNDLRIKVYGNREINSQQDITERKDLEVPSDPIQQEDYILKQQNISPDQPHPQKSDHHPRAFSAQEGIQQHEQQGYKIQKHPIVKSQIQQSPEHLQQNQIYPFHNYSYEIQMCNYQQMHEFQMNHLLYYHPYRNFPLPTAETYQNTLEVNPPLKEQQREQPQNVKKS